MVRKLTLKSERLAELDTDELGRVVGGQSELLCLTRDDRCGVSRQAITLCDCLTQICSIDIC